MKRTKQSKGFLILLLRGVLGGMVGGFIFAVVEVCVMRPNALGNWIGWFLMICIVVLPITLVISTALSIGYWFFYRETGIELGILARGIIGTIVGITVYATTWLSGYRERNVRNPLIVDIIGLVLIGVAFGGIPGIVIGIQKSGEAPSKVDAIANSESQP